MARSGGSRSRRRATCSAQSALWCSSRSQHSEERAYNDAVATYSELRLLMPEIRKWLTGGYGPLPDGITLLIKPADYDQAVLKELSESALIIRARALLGDARRVIDQLALVHPNEARLINNLTFHSSAL